MSAPIDPTGWAAIDSWPAAVAVVVLILALLVVPQVGAWVQARRSAAAVHEVRTMLHHEVNPNSGGSLRDAVDRLEVGVRDQSEQTRALAARVSALERRRRWRG